MYESIRGRLLERAPASAVVDCGGLAYRCQIPLSTYERLPSAGDEVVLLLHLTVREDEWRLFGFSDADQREGFRALIRVNGVGPIMAMSVLSTFTPDELSATVSQGDVTGLTRVKGVGRKTAERIVVELRDVFAAATPSPRAAPATAPAIEAVRALEALGQDPLQARQKVDKALAAMGGATDDVTALVRAALRV